MTTRCSHCGAAFEPPAWRALELIQLLDTARVCELVTSWPDGASIEVRRCACGRSLARKVAEGYLASSAGV